MTYSHYWRAVIVLALLIVSVGTITDSASAQTAPSISVEHAACYRSVLADDDLFCLTRYELPDSISDGVSDAWCAVLVDQDGCSGTPAAPTAPTSLPINTVFVTLYDGCSAGDCSAGTLLNVARVPRIGFALGGSYMNTGHTVTWGGTDVHLCLESSDDPADFAVPSIDCLPVFWNTSANTAAAQRNVLGEDMVDQVRAVGILQSQPTNAYVQNGLINSVGKVYALETLENADRILNVFSEGASVIVIPGNTPTAGSTVQAQIDGATSTVQTAKDSFGTIFGISGDGAGVLISLVIIVAAMIFLLAASQNLLFALVGGVSLAVSLTVFGLLPFQVLGVFIVILALPAGVKLIRTATQ